MSSRYRPSSTASNNYCPGSYSSNNSYGIGASIGKAFEAIAEARQNKQNRIDNAIATNNHWNLPNGTHTVNGQKVVKGDGYIRYDYGNGHGCVVTPEGSADHIIGRL